MKNLIKRFERAEKLNFFQTYIVMKYLLFRDIIKALIEVFTDDDKEDFEIKFYDSTKDN